MVLSLFIGFLGGVFLLLAALFSGIDRWRLGRLFVYTLVLYLFMIAGFRSLAINSDTRSYASYALHFQQAATDADPDVSDRLEWGFRALLRSLAFLLPKGDPESYPRDVNLTIAALGALLLCRAVSAAKEKLSGLLLIYFGCLFFVHQFALIRLGLATLCFLNYFIPSYYARRPGLSGIGLLVAGCLLHYTILCLTVLLLIWEFVLRGTRRPNLEVGVFGFLICVAIFFGMLVDHIAPLFLSGYHLSLITRASESSFSVKGMLEVTLCAAIFLIQFTKIRWSKERQHVRWRVLFYLTMFTFLLEVVSGLPFAGRFRILGYCLFLMQTMLITNGLNFKRKTTWLVVMSASASVAALVITMLKTQEWSFFIASQ